MSEIERLRAVLSHIKDYGWDEGGDQCAELASRALCESYNSRGADMAEVEGLQHLLRALADKEGELNKELFQKSADKIDQLEWVASVAVRIVDQTPRDGEIRSLIGRDALLELMRALQGAGKRVKSLRP